MLGLAQLQPLIHASFELFACRVHLNLLFLHEFGLSSENLFMSVLHVGLALILFHLVGPLLHLVRLLVVLLLGEVLLNLAQVEELGRVFKFERERRLQVLPVLL